MDQLLLDDILRTTAARVPKRVAISYRDTSLTYAEVLSATDHLSAVLAGRGIGRGDRVAWWADTNIHAAILYYALASIGAVFVPLNPRFKDEECQAVLDIVDPALVVCDDGHQGDVLLSELLAARPPSRPEISAVREDDPDVIFFTSGTTGQPKGVVLSHRANRLRTQASNDPMGVTTTMFPQFHWGGWSFCHTAWYAGHEFALVDGGNTAAILETMDRRKVTSFYGIPAVWRRIFEADRSAYDLSSLKDANTGTSATPAELLQTIGRTFPGTSTWIGYGATEAGGLCRLAPEDLFRKPGSVGLPSAGLAIRVEDGELWVKSPQAFSGYFRNPEATAAAVTDGWYHTGDLIERDEEGYVWVVGRAKDMIRTGGETVAPAEVDVVLQRHPAVRDAAVAGVPDVDWGEVVTAFVVLRAGASVDLPSLRQHCEGSLAAYKHPRRLVEIDAIPRTGPTGQVQRRLLVEFVQAAVAMGGGP